MRRCRRQRSPCSPHIAVNDYVTQTGRARKTSIDGRTTRHKGYNISQSKCKMIECLFGWGKQHGTMRKTKHWGLVGVAADVLLNLIGYNLIRIPKLLAQME
ncbi:MAG: transposase [Nitrospira sp.]|nr:transposase [Nitrospira sp.]